MALSTESGAAADAAPDTGTRGTRRAPLWVLAALLVGLLLGTGAGLVIPRLTTPGDTSPEAGFLRDMATHHAQAVEMSMIAHANSTNPEIISLAADIATTQQAQIGYMQAWLRDWKISPTGGTPMSWMPDGAGSLVDGLMPGMATPAQLGALRKATGKDLDVQFLTLMRQHHLGGIHMAQEAVKLTDDDNVDWLARSMISGQQGEISLINDLLAQLQGS